MKKVILTLITSIAILSNSFSQITQTVRGTITDVVTQETLVGATVLVVDSDPTVAAICDIDGNFILENVPIGRQSMEISMLGYETYIANELMISSGKETVLNIALQTSNIGLDEVVVTVGKDVPLNTMATLSARQFTVEETERYAGGMDDPARLASSFAGVATPAVNSNGISVRGNNPQGLLWHVEGVEVPNPNHFANLSVVGGGLYTVLSNQMLANSDFYTGAFPAEYGNAYSGVFDIRMKTGNTSEREYTFKAGIIGIDFATEGPFKNGKQASYAMNYRYSTLGLLASVMPKDAGVISFQDLSFKTVFPTKKAGTFSFWGMGAIDGVKIEAMDSTNWKADFDRDDSGSELYLYATALSHKIQLGKKTFLNSSISASGSGFSHIEKRLDNNLQKYPQSDVANNEWRYTIQSNINHSFGEKITSRTGFYYSHLGYNIDIEQAPSNGMPLQKLADGSGVSDLFQLYTQSRINLIPQLTLNVGLHYQHLLLNNNYSIQPRAGIKYNINSKNSIAFAYGLHSRLEVLQAYFVDINGTNPNKELDLMKSNHFVLGYELKLNDNLRLKVEPYYQKLVDVPVSPTNYISTLNMKSSIFFSEVLTNKGSGHNIGIDITLERFFNKDFYYLITASVFDSKYTAADGIKRNTLYNKNYVFNALSGKEWMVGKNNNNVLGVNLRLNYLGGNRIEPVDRAASLASQDIIYGEKNGKLAYSEQLDDMPVFSFGVSFLRNKAKYSSVWAVQVVNILGTKEFVQNYYNIRTNTIEQKYDGIIVPNVSYKIEF